MTNKKEIYYQYFEDKIVSKILPLEQKRINIVRKVILNSILFFAVGIIFAGLFIYNTLHPVFMTLFLPVLLFLMYVFILKSIINVIVTCIDYQKLLLKEVLPLFLEPIANFKQWPENDIDTILNSQLFKNFDDVEEHIRYFGFYKNTSIRIGDTRLILPVKNSTKSYLFRGTTIKLELPKSINNHIILQSKNMPVVNKYKQFNPHIKELNNYLYCFAKKNNNIDIISDEFWGKIKKFGEIYTAKSFSLSYLDNTLLIALKQKKPMQFGFLFKSLLKAKNYDELIERFIVIFDLIDFLNN